VGFQICVKVNIVTKKEFVTRYIFSNAELFSDNDKEKEFEDYIDGLYDEVTIAGSIFYASKILKELDPNYYSQCLSEYMDNTYSAFTDLCGDSWYITKEELDDLTSEAETTWDEDQPDPEDDEDGWVELVNKDLYGDTRKGM
jgi:hypothetical protein